MSRSRPRFPLSVIHVIPQTAHRKQERWIRSHARTDQRLRRSSPRNFQTRSKKVL